MRVFSVILLFFVMLPAGCSSRKDGNFHSSVEMNDTSAEYDLWVIVRTPAGCPADSIRMTVRIMSPDGMRYSMDTLVIPAGKCIPPSEQDRIIRSCRSVLSCDVKALYRTGVHPVQPGKWEMSFKADPSHVDGVWAYTEKKNLNHYGKER